MSKEFLDEPPPGAKSLFLPTTVHPSRSFPFSHSISTLLSEIFPPPSGSWPSNEKILLLTDAHPIEFLFRLYSPAPVSIAGAIADVVTTSVLPSPSVYVISTLICVLAST